MEYWIVNIVKFRILILFSAYLVNFRERSPVNKTLP